MSEAEKTLVEVVIEHLTDVLGGECRLTHAEIEALAEREPQMAEVLAGILCLHEDLVFKESERQRAEDALRGIVEKLAEQNRELEANRRELEALAAELSTPVITLWEGALLMPIVGSVDSKRAQEIMGKVLDAVATTNARYVILDLTGVQTVDVATADSLVRIVSAARLVGASGILAGAQPAVATAIAAIAVDLGDAKTVRDVQAALKICMKPTASDPAPMRRTSKSVAGTVR
jgi:anti-anti-sigma regulatory factor